PEVQMLKDHSDSRAEFVHGSILCLARQICVNSVARYRISKHCNISAIGRFKAIEATKQGCLATSTRTNHRHRLSFTNAKRYAVQSDCVAESFTDAVHANDNVICIRFHQRSALSITLFWLF